MLIIAPGQQNQYGCLSEFIEHEVMLCILIRIASSRRFERVFTIYHFQYKKENRPKFFQIFSYRFFSKGLKNEFETAMVNEPSMFEQPKLYCIYRSCSRMSIMVFLSGIEQATAGLTKPKPVCRDNNISLE